MLSNAAPALGHLPASRQTGPSTGAALARTPIATRRYEIAALRSDGSLYIGQERAPALSFFEQAFSAFARGTLVQSVDGEVAVEDLQPGDRLITGSGDPAEVTWIGSSSFVPADVGRRMSLIRIMPDSFGQSRPGTYLTLGPSARILHTPHHLRGIAGGARLLTPVRHFVDGVNVIEVVPPTSVRLFHICLNRHAVIRANDIEVETFHPGIGTMRSQSLSLRERFLGMFPHISHASDFGPLANPRAPEVLDELV